MEQVTHNVSVLKVNYRFSSENVQVYAKFINEALASEKKVIVFADKEAREKVKELFPLFVDMDVFAKITVRAYPNCRRSAMNLTKGYSSLASLFIDEKGRFSDDLIQSISVVNTQSALIVHNL